MAVLLHCTPTILSTPFANRTTAHFPLRPHSHTFSPSTKRSLRGSLSVSRFGFQPGFLPEPDDTEFVIRELFNRAEGYLYTIADAAVSNSDAVVNTAIATTKQNNDWLSLITYYVETVLKVLKFGLSTLHVPYAYGFAIIMLAVLVNAATFPFAIKKVEYTMERQFLEPEEKAIMQQYAGVEITNEAFVLSRSGNFDPLPVLLPVLLRIPVWIGLYQAFSKMADGEPLSEGFFWIPSLSGPTTFAAQQNGNGISWLFPFVDGHPLLGWPDTLAYLVLPVLLAVSHYITPKIISSSKGPSIIARALGKGDSSFGISSTFESKDIDPNVKSSQETFDDNFQDIDWEDVKSSQEIFDVNFQDTDPNMESFTVLDIVLISLYFFNAIRILIPLMIGCFALLVPSGLSLYWFTENMASKVRRCKKSSWLPKLGGAKNPQRPVLDDNVKNDPKQI